MKAIYRFLHRLASLFDAGPADPTASFTPRDWADLPPYHPLCERS